MYTVHFMLVGWLVISCWLFGSVYSDSLFGVDFTAPARVGNTGVREISQVIKPQPPQYSNFPFGGNNPLSDDNANSNKNEGLVKHASVPIFDRIKPHQPSKINKSTEANNQFSDNHIPIKDDHGSDSEKVSESIPQETNQNTDTGVSKPESHGYKLDLSGTDINDYTTETLDYETTTMESLNRIGGAPPAVVASLLG